MNYEKLSNNIRSLFHINSKINIYEAYAEFWAEILNCVYSSYYLVTNKKNKHKMLDIFEQLVNIERRYSFFQMVKILKYMNLKYDDLYTNKYNPNYKEQTNIFSYYIIKTILLNKYNQFIHWCVKNNTKILQFKYNNNVLDNLFVFIKQNYNSKTMLHNIKYTEKLVNKQIIKNKNIFNSNIHFILTNLRISLIELNL